MKVILSMAISADGYIAGEGDDTDWVSDAEWQVFGEMVHKANFIVMGRVTYETSSDDFPLGSNAVNVVMTRNHDLHAKTEPDIVFTDRTPTEIVALAKEKGAHEILLVGGGETNTAFLNENLIDEIFLRVHPVVLTGGTKLFNDSKVDLNMELVSIKQLTDDVIQLHYRVIK